MTRRVPTMSDNTAADRITYLLIGAGLGAAFALLFAPKSGRELRDDLGDLSRKTYSKGADGVRDASHRINEGAQGVAGRVTESVHSVREGFEKQKGNIASAIDAGKQAYKEERGRS
ncbi:MAG: hypothetical protein GF346_11835 [Candidatus Eisenbacteria bacterium]|nr:hypothetical protein [Candidatus Latescibacterota bacterium]MBD3303127.1 hypothetical protein [Candidatus Eisenbacteria bacterium]